MDSQGFVSAELGLAGLVHCRFRNIGTWVYSTSLSPLSLSLRDKNTLSAPGCSLNRVIPQREAGTKPSNSDPQTHAATD